MSCRLVNVLIVAPESLPTLIDSSLKEAREEAVRYGLLTVDSQYPFSACLLFRLHWYVLSIGLAGTIP